MPVAGLTHHITIEYGGSIRGFMIAPGSYLRQRADDFAPRIASGNDTATQQGLWQSWAQSGFTGGVDQREFSDNTRIYRTDGNVFCHRDKRISLDSEWVLSDAGVTATAPMVVELSNNLVLVAAGTKVRRYNISSGTWAASTTTFAGNVIWLHRHGAKVYAGVAGSHEIYDTTDGDVWTQNVNTPNGQRASCLATMEVSGGTVYLVLSDANIIKLSSDNGVTWGTAINIGDASSDITNMITAFGSLFIRKTDGLYWYNGSSVQEVWRHPNTRYSGNVCLAYHEGFLYLNEINKIYKLAISDGNISNFTDVTPRMLGDKDKELYGHGVPKWMWSGKEGLYVAFDDGEGVYPEVLVLNAMGGWHQAYRGASGDTMTAGGYSQAAGRIFINDGATRLRRTTSLSDMPFPAYPATGEFITSFHAGGFPDMDKAYGVLSVEARNLSAAEGRKIVFYHSTDKGATWTETGTAETDGKTEFQFDSEDAAVNADSMMIKGVLHRGSSATETPVLERFAVSFLLRPNPVYAYSVTVEIGPEQLRLDGAKESYSPAELLEFLRQAERSNTPVRFTDNVGEQHLVYISRTSERQVVYEGEAERDTRLVDVAMIDAYNGLWVQQINLLLEVTVHSAVVQEIVYTPAVWDTPQWGFFQWE